MKKTIVLFTCLLLFSNKYFSQTNIIALKSASANTNQINDFNDNFGIHPDMYEKKSDSIKYIPEKKIVIQYSSNYFGVKKDTFNYKNESDKEILEHLRVIRWEEWYNSKAKYINFPEEIEKKNPSKINTNKLSIWIVLSVLGFSFMNIKNRK